jgi:anti-sigma regulatory factor (Ser/Thr protein kinase)
MITAPRPHFLQLVHDQSHPGEARRWAVRLATDFGLDEDDTGRVAIIVTELAHNLVKHSGGGELLMRGMANGELRGFEVIALDKGEGMDVSITMEDGFSTTGTPGTGLGAIRRQSDQFDVFTAPRQGTALLSRVWAGRKAPTIATSLETGAVCVPVKGERECGDLWQALDFGGRFIATVVDGLGHGVDAAEAAEEAVRIFQTNAAYSPCNILERAHDALKKTRGAAMSIVEHSHGKTSMRFAGIGNVSSSLLASEKTQSMVSHNGTLGAQIRRCQEFEYPFSSAATLVMHSDGLTTSWDAKQYRGISRRDPTLLAALLYRDFARGRDDVTVLVVRERAA